MPIELPAHQYPACCSTIQDIHQCMLTLSRTGPGCAYRWCILDWQTGSRFEQAADAPCPASSTRKLFILIAVLREIETGNWRLDDRLWLLPQAAGQQTCGALWLLDEPRAFTIAELLKCMMALSDNVATFHLVRRLGLQRLNAFSKMLQLHHTHHVGAVPNPLLDADHPLEAVNTTTASDLVKALELMVQGVQGTGRGPTFIAPELCEFGLACMRGQQDTTAIRSWLDDASHVGDKHGIGYRNYNNVGYFMRQGQVKVIVSVIVDDLNHVAPTTCAFAHARDFIGLFSRLLDDYCTLQHD